MIGPLDRRTDDGSLRAEVKRLISGLDGTSLTRARHLLRGDQAQGSVAADMAGSAVAASPQAAQLVQATENFWRRIADEFGMLSTAEAGVRLGAAGARPGVPQDGRRHHGTGCTACCDDRQRALVGPRRREHSHAQCERQEQRNGKRAEGHQFGDHDDRDGTRGEPLTAERRSCRGHRCSLGKPSGPVGHPHGRPTGAHSGEVASATTRRDGQAADGTQHERQSQTRDREQRSSLGEPAVRSGPTAARGFLGRLDR